MIGTLIFDLGNVLVNWSPTGFLQDLLHCGSQEAARLNRLVFGGPVWRLGDQGVLDRAEIEARLVREAPGDRAAIHRILAHCEEILTEYPENTALLAGLRAAGFELYYLSNTNPPAFSHMREHCGFFPLFSGGIASFRYGVLKPGPEIYRLFVNTFHKDPETCLFIDDTEENIRGAASCGFIARRLPRPEELWTVLSEFPELRSAMEGQQ